MVLNELEKEGQVIRKAYQRRLPSDTSKDYYFIQRETGITEPITVEYGFLDNAKDAAKLKDNYIKYAQAVARAIIKYVGSDSNTYKVVAGDTLWSIARKFNTTVNEIKELNKLSSNSLFIGQVLKIPVKEEVVGDNVYVVQSGDSLWSIARKFNTTVTAIKEKNNLKSDLLNIGQKLIIPEDTNEFVTYTVKSGDTLYKIANNFNTTVQEIMSFNNLKSNLLSIGQVLKIPGISDRTYTVVAGDSLWSIARKFNTTVDNLRVKNNLKSDLLSIGQVLKV